MSMIACKREKKGCAPIIPEIDKSLHAKVLVVPSNLHEYNYFKEVMARYSYNAELTSYGIRYTGKTRSYLVVTLLKPGETVNVKYGIIQLKGHTEDMAECLARARQCIVPGKSIIISGGCETSKDVCMYADMNIPAFTVNHIGQGPVNDYLVLQMQAHLQDYSYSETLQKLKMAAPIVMGYYIYPQ